MAIQEVLKPKTRKRCHECRSRAAFGVDRWKRGPMGEPWRVVRRFYCVDCVRQYVFPSELRHAQGRLAYLDDAKDQPDPSEKGGSE